MNRGKDKDIVYPERKDSIMLIPQQAQYECQDRHGCHDSAGDEPKTDQAVQAAWQIPAGISQQRLLELAQRLARVQALGGEYTRVEFSPTLAEMASKMMA
ncbi:MAG: hypothetical protein HQ546_02325 [Planctomycetes bacterium]|nr:hypothetical protein [Planctomycetota bacterium]